MNVLSRTAIAAAVAAAAVAALASDARAGVVLVPASGGVGAEMPDLPQRVTRVINEVAARHGLVARLADSTREDVFAAAGCTQDTDACHQSVMQRLGADKLILIHVTPGAGGAVVDVEVVVATRGKSPVKVGIPLMSESQDQLLEELRRKAGRAFGSTEAPAATTGPPGATVDPPVPGENKTIQADIKPGEGGSFASPEGAEKAGAKPGDTEAPAAAVTAPADDDEGGGYDFTRVNNSTWAIAGASGGVFLIGALFLNAAGNKEDEVARSRANTLEDIQRLQDIESTGKTLNTIGNTGVLLGLAGLGVAGYLVYREAKVPASERSEVSVAPVISPDGFGVMATVRR